MLTITAMSNPQGKVTHRMLPNEKWINKLISKFKEDSTMTVKIKESELREAINCSEEIGVNYIDKATGKFIWISQDHAPFLEGTLDEVAEELNEDGSLDEQLARKDIMSILNNPDRYVQVPTEDENRDWYLRDRFANTIKDVTMREALKNQLSGQGAFGRFNEFLNKHKDVSNDWDVYQENDIKSRMIEFCNEHGLELETE